MERKKLSEIGFEQERRNSLNSLARLEDFKYDCDALDSPTPEQTAEEQREAEEIQYIHLERYHRFTELLYRARDKNNLLERINWLRDLGYEGVCIKGNRNPMPFLMALDAGYQKNICRMFENEKRRLSKMREESRKFAFFEN